MGIGHGVNTRGESTRAEATRSALSAASRLSGTSAMQPCRHNGDLTCRAAEEFLVKRKAITGTYYRLAGAQSHVLYHLLEALFLFILISLFKFQLHIYFVFFRA